jgi:DivIVA domain-containing protein
VIELSPLDVRKKKDDFARALRGYEPDQVDSFLDVVADRLEQLVRDERGLRERVGTLEEELERFREREKALNDALLAAQELREEARTQAEREAELRIKEAESQAEKIVDSAREEAREAQRRLDDLRRRRDAFLRSFRSTLERFLDEIDAEESRLDDRRGDVPASDDDLTVENEDEGSGESGG